jgi:ATP-dependent protease ClpP protease subunit
MIKKDNITTETDLATLHNYNIDITNREIYLHSCISDNDEESGVDYRSAVVFEKNIRYLNLINLDPIFVHMHLPGGAWQDCLGMYDTVKSSKARIVILAYATAESSSSVLLQSAHLRILMPNTNVLIHYGFLSLDAEHSKAAASSIKWNEQECEKMIDIFTDRCMNSSIAKEKNWKKMMARKHIVSQIANKCDWILTADEAVYYGFADGILGSKKFPNIDYIKNYAKKI